MYGIYSFHTLAVGDTFFVNIHKMNDALLYFSFVVLLRYMYLDSQIQTQMWKMYGPIGTYMVLAALLTCVCVKSKRCVLTKCEIISAFVIGRVMYKIFVASEYDLQHNSTFKNDCAFILGAALSSVALFPQTSRTDTYKNTSK